MHIDSEIPGLHAQDELDEENPAERNAARRGVPRERRRVNEKRSRSRIERIEDEAEQSDAGDDRIEVAPRDAITADGKREKDDEPGCGLDPFGRGRVRFPRWIRS